VSQLAYLGEVLACHHENDLACSAKVFPDDFQDLAWETAQSRRLLCVDIFREHVVRKNKIDISGAFVGSAGPLLQMLGSYRSR